MKREELTPIDLECNMGPDVNGVVQREPWKAYDIDEVNLLLDEKDAEIESLNAKLENVQASAYADSVDAGMRERRLNRALWLALADAAYFRKYVYIAVIREEHLKPYNSEVNMDGEWGYGNQRKMTPQAWLNCWEHVRQKCLKKAEEYK